MKWVFLILAIVSLFVAVSSGIELFGIIGFDALVAAVILNALENKGGAA